MDAPLTVAQAARLIRSGQLSPVELTRTSLDRIAALDGQLDSFITVTPERAMHDARRAEEEIRRDGPRSPLHGIPYALKDIFETAGIRTTGHSRLLEHNVPAADAWAETLLQRAGGVLAGKTATWEFAHGGPSWDLPFPPARNPWDIRHSPGGSSSGSAAAVAAGLVPFALGTDTGGSIRAPASACGVAGLKPTYGLVSRRGVLPNSFSHDHVGPLAATSEDITLVLPSIAGFDPDDPGSARAPVADYAGALTGDLVGLAVGVPQRWLDEETTLRADTRRAFEAALDVVRGLGAALRPVELPPLIDFDDAKKTMSVTELFVIYQEHLRRTPELFGANFRYRVIAGSLIRAEDYVQAARLRTALARATQRVFAEVDLLVLPTGEPAPLLAPAPPSNIFTGRNLTTPFNLSGNPALSVRNGFTADGLPYGLQIVGRLFGEAAVLRAGDAFERAMPSRERRPALSPGSTSGGALGFRDIPADR